MATTLPAGVTAEHVVDEILDRLRSNLAKQGPLPWARYFTPHLVEGAFSPLHDELNDWHLAQRAVTPGRKDAFGAPRGHGKSTAGIELGALWHAAECVRRFTVIVSDTYDQAVQRLATIITEVEENPKLRAAYPKLRPKIDAKGQLVRWRDNDIEFECGCRIMAAGAGKSLRGARKGNQRPDLLLLDDLEDEDSVATDKSIDKRLRWLLRVALGLADARTGISALWVGTILSRSALLNQATGAALDEGQERPDWARVWRAHVFAAENRGTPKKRTVVTVREPDPVTGKEHLVVVRGNDGKPLAYDVGEPMWSILKRGDLARIRYTIGSLSYAAEYLSDPVDAETTILAPPRPAVYLNPASPPAARLVQLPAGRIIPVSAMTRAAALDPQFATDTGRNDPDLAAIVVAGQYGAETFLLDVWIGRDRHGQAARLIDLAIRWDCYAAGVEANGAQIVQADKAAADGRVPVVSLKPIEGKADRAMGLAVRLGDKDKPEECRVWAMPPCYDDSGEGSLVHHLGRYPHGRYDDPVDATVYAVELAARAAPRGSGSESGPRSEPTPTPPE